MKGSIFVWIATIILIGLVYIYFFYPEFYNHIFQYPGPGSPYVNTPEG